VTSIKRKEYIFENKKNEILYPPTEENKYFEGMEFEKKNEFHFVSENREESFVDIVFSGIGWVSICGIGNIHVETFSFKNLSVYSRSPFLPYEVAKIKSKDHYEIF
jgi:hypothetical protein